MCRLKDEVRTLTQDPRRSVPKQAEFVAFVLFCLFWGDVETGPYIALAVLELDM